MGVIVTSMYTEEAFPLPRITVYIVAFPIELLPRSLCKDFKSFQTF